MSLNTRRGFSLVVLAVPDDVRHRSEVITCARYDFRSRENLDVSTEDIKYVGQRLADTMKMILDDAFKRHRKRRSNMDQLLLERRR
jgi:hypothetical protein